MTIFYELYDALYINITNKCPCSCSFCIRTHSDTIKNSEPLWFKGEEPSLDEIKKDLENFDWKKYSEFVFCGYGEPTQRLEVLVETAKYLKKKTGKKIRLNTNGLSDLINKRENTAKDLSGLIDTVSISLNAPDAKSYLDITKSCFGIDSFDAMLRYASDAKKSVSKLVFTVVDVIGDEAVNKCQDLADSMGIELKVRKYIETY